MNKKQLRRMALAGLLPHQRAIRGESPQEDVEKELLKQGYALEFEKPWLGGDRGCYYTKDDICTLAEGHKVLLRSKDSEQWLWGKVKRTTKVCVRVSGTGRKTVEQRKEFYWPLPESTVEPVTGG